MTSLDLMQVMEIVDMKREMLYFLPIEDVINIQLVNSVCYELIEKDDILWNEMSMRYFKVELSMKNEDHSEDAKSPKEMFCKLMKSCICCEYKLVTPIPMDMWTDEKRSNEKCEISVSSRKFPFKTNLVPAENLRAEYDNSLPTSSLIYEHDISALPKPLSEKTLQMFKLLHAHYAFFFYRSCRLDEKDGKYISFLDELLGFDMSKFDLVVTEKDEEDLESETRVGRMIKIIEVFEQKAKTFDFKSYEDFYSSERAEEILKLHTANPKSKIHSIHIDYKKNSNILHAYWNFKNTKDPIKCLVISDVGMMLRHWYVIYDCVKKLFSIDILKKPSFGLRNLSKKVKMLKYSKKVSVKMGKKDRVRKNIRMKWKTFFEPLNFRFLMQVGLKPVEDYYEYELPNRDSIADQMTIGNISVLARRDLNNVRSVSIRNHDNSQIVFNFCNCDGGDHEDKKGKDEFGVSRNHFKIFDHAFHMNTSYTTSNISSTIGRLSRERNEEAKRLEEEWQKELDDHNMRHMEEAYDSDASDYDFDM